VHSMIVEGLMFIRVGVDTNHLSRTSPRFYRRPPQLKLDPRMNMIWLSVLMSVSVYLYSSLW
jgi:hypothetical protein